MQRGKPMQQRESFLNVVVLLPEKEIMSQMSSYTYLIGHTGLYGQFHLQERSEKDYLAFPGHIVEGWQRRREWLFWQPSIVSATTKSPVNQLPIDLLSLFKKTAHSKYASVYINTYAHIGFGNSFFFFKVISVLLYVFVVLSHCCHSVQQLPHP